MNIEHMMSDSDPNQPVTTKTKWEQPEVTIIHVGETATGHADFKESDNGGWVTS